MLQIPMLAVVGLFGGGYLEWQAGRVLNGSEVTRSCLEESSDPAWAFVHWPCCSYIRREGARGQMNPKAHQPSIGALQLRGKGAVRESGLGLF